MINVFIGYDKNEKVAFNVLSYSILKHSTRPVAITPIYLPNIKDSFIRERSNIESTDFSFSRFIVPHLMNYQGWAFFFFLWLLNTTISRKKKKNLWVLYKQNM